MTPLLRQIRGGDETEAMRLARAFHAESVYRDMPLALSKVDELVRLAIDGGDRWCLVADFGDHLGGYLMAVIHEHYFGFTRTCSDLGFYIEPAHRNAFLARAMIDKLEAWAFHVKQVEDISLGISSGVADPLVERFYKRCGYTRGFSGLIKARLTRA